MLATPADAALTMQLGAEGVLTSDLQIRRSRQESGRYFVKAVTNFTYAKLIAELSEDLGEDVGRNPNVERD